jgi:O-antigen biosynthesis protein
MFSAPGLRLVKSKIVRLIKNDLDDTRSYHSWIANRLEPGLLEAQYRAGAKYLVRKPLISIVMPVYNPPLQFLREAILSVQHQFYDNWELCIADDRSPDIEIADFLSHAAAGDTRIKVTFRDINGHISACTNSAIALATGEYVLFMDHDDLLTPNCLFEIVKHINLYPHDRIIYSDEDKIDADGNYQMPHFKPDWAPDNLLSRNYMGHVVVMERKLVEELYGLREGFEGSQDYDLMLRATEKTQAVGHIPKVLYHWRIHAHSVAEDVHAKPYAYIAAKKALEEALTRRGTDGSVEEIPFIPGGYRIRYTVTTHDKVSIIIPSKDQVKLLRKTIDSIRNLTDYPNYEIILINNNSTEPEFFTAVAEYQQLFGDRFRCYDASFPFNFSKLINLGVSKSSGKYLLFLNNDVEIIHGDWMTQMVSFAQRATTGAVGVKLLYANDTVQHAGVVLGLGGAAGHVFVGQHRKQSGYFNYILSRNNYSALTAACLMCRREVYDAVNGFDETLEVEYNDIDFCLKLLAKGYYNVYVPDVELYHYESATRGQPYASKKSWAQHEKDFDRFNQKWHNLIKNDPFYSPNLSLDTDDFRINHNA